MAALKVSFDLSSLLAKGFTDKQRRALTPQINRVALKQEFGQRAIEAILARTNAGKDVAGVSFSSYAPYSSSYKKSRDYKLFGKSSRVNLKLSGEMQAAVGIQPSAGPVVTVFIPDGLQSKKGRRHNFGLSGMPRRFWFDLSEKDQINILKGLLRDVNAVDNLEQIQEALTTIQQDIQIQTVIGEETAIPLQQTSVSASILSILDGLSEEGQGDGEG